MAEFLYNTVWGISLILIIVAAILSGLGWTGFRAGRSKRKKLERFLRRHAALHKVSLEAILLNNACHTKAGKYIQTHAPDVERIAAMSKVLEKLAECSRQENEAG